MSIEYWIKSKKSLKEGSNPVRFDPSDQLQFRLRR